MRVILIAALATALAGAACSDAGMHQQSAAKPAQSGAGKAAAPQAADYADRQRGAHPRRWGKWRWSGAGQDCFFRYRNACFSKFDKACAAAGCKPDACVHDGSAPAVVSCKQ